MIDEVADSEGASRAALVRDAIATALAERRRRQGLQAVVDSYATTPPEALTLPKRALRAAWPE